MAALNVQQGFFVGFGLALGLTMTNYMLYAYNPQARVVRPVLVCLKCGGKNSIDNKFCWHCGHPFYPALQTKCPKCGSTTTRNANFCENCGARLKEK